MHRIFPINNKNNKIETSLEKLVPGVENEGSGSRARLTRCCIHKRKGQNVAVESGI